MHIKRIVKDIYVYAILLKMKKKVQSLVFVFFFYRLDLPAVAELFMSLAVVNIKDYADKNVEM